MSKVKIQGNSSGTGVLTIEAPNTNDDSTITLPDGTGTLLTTDGDGSSLTGVGVDGISSSANATAITIDSNENVGIGVTPESWNANYSALQIGSVGSLYGYTAVADGAEVVLGCNEYSSKYITADQASQYNQYDGKHFFKVAPSGSADAAISWTTAMQIDDDGSIYCPTGTGSTGGKFGFGTSSPTGKVHVKYDGWNGCKGIEMEDVYGGSSDTWAIKFSRNGTHVGDIRTYSSSTNYNTSSDYRLKEDVKPMSASIDRLKELKPVNFAWKLDGSRVDGFLAHEAQEVVSEAITGEKDDVDDDGNAVYQGIDQSKLVPLLTSALQEAVAKIEELTTRIEILEAN